MRPVWTAFFLAAFFLSTTEFSTVVLASQHSSKTCCGTADCRCGKGGNSFCRFMAKKQEAGSHGMACHFQKKQPVNYALVAWNESDCRSLTSLPSLKKGRCGDDHGPAGLTASGKDFLPALTQASIFAFTVHSRMNLVSSFYSADFDRRTSKPPESLLS